jgi:hypothetical protein
MNGGVRNDAIHLKRFKLEKIADVQMKFRGIVFRRRRQSNIRHRTVMHRAEQREKIRQMGHPAGDAQKIHFRDISVFAKDVEREEICIAVVIDELEFGVVGFEHF